MKVIAFNGSPKAQGNTYQALSTVGDVLESQGVDVEMIHVGNKVIRGCMACGACGRTKNGRCIYEEDPVNEWIAKMQDADGILLGTPVHFAGIGGTMKAFLDRAFYVASVNGGLFRHKVGASVVADRRAGGVSVFDQLNHFLNYSEMILATANYWNVAYGDASGEVTQDDEGMQIMCVLGGNMAWLLRLRAAGKTAVPDYSGEEKIFTNFIR